MSRRSDTPYFSSVPDAPRPLTARIGRRVRFEEMDPLGIVWHGRYPSYLEDGRAAFGEKYGLSYMTMHNEGFHAPIVRMHIDYHSPLTFHEGFMIEAALHWTEAVRFNFQYAIVAGGGRVVATGYTVQLVTGLNKEVLLTRNGFLEEFCAKWKDGRFDE